MQLTLKRRRAHCTPPEDVQYPCRKLIDRVEPLSRKSGSLNLTELEAIREAPLRSGAR